MVKKLGFILVTHGDIGRSLLDVARYILGRGLDNFAVVKVPFMSELQESRGADASAPFAAREKFIREKINGARDLLDQCDGILILTDVLGGTGFNVARQLMRRDEGVVIAGVNLPMVLKAAELETSNPGAAAAELADRSRRAIVCRAPLG
ncbi:MAG: hypothetical protein V1706_15405 [Pseudomonadota bacterium]